MIAENIRRIRKDSFTTQKDLAEAMCVTQQAVHKWENGSSIPQVDRAREMADFLNCPVESILCDNGNDFSYLIPMDMTGYIEDEIARLKDKQAKSGLNFAEKMTLVFDEDALNSECRSTGGVGKYIVNLCLNEMEWNIWKAMKLLDKTYDVENFAEIVKNRAVLQCRRNNN